MYQYRVLFFLLMFLSVSLIVDIYFYFGIKTLVHKHRRFPLIKRIYWTIAVAVLLFYFSAVVLWFMGMPIQGKLRIIFQGISFCLLVPKFIGVLFFMVDDTFRGVRWVFFKLKGGAKTELDQSSPIKVNSRMKRLKFLQLTGLSFFALFTGIFSYGIFRGAYSINVLYKKLKLSNLPEGFKGLKIIQISDMHLGSFMSADPVKRMVNLINQENPDIVVFTGDLVNDIAEEALPYVEELKKLQAKLGVFAILGNHDYGDYYYNKTDPDFEENKAHNKTLMKQIYKACNWRLLLDEHVIFEDTLGGKLALIGIENWGGKGNFARYGDLHKAYKGCENAEVKILLSHDPSHWDVQVREAFKDIELTLSGHTHGMQFGVEIPGIKWSPSKYIYTQWAGLYKKGKQQLYVNRGIGFIGYPGRVGIYPEISVFTLQS